MAFEDASWWYARSEGHKLGQIRLVPTKQWVQKKEGHGYGALSNTRSTSVKVNYTGYTAVAVKLQVDSQCPLP